MPDRPTLHLTLVIPGAVALGAYEAGVLTVLVNTIRASQANGATGPRLVVDAIAGASAGAMTAALVAHILLTGATVDSLRQAWVEDIDIDHLLDHPYPDAALSHTIVEQIADKFLGAPVVAPDAYRQKEPIRLVFALTNLTGRYVDWKASKQTSIGTLTYSDWIHFRMASGVPWSDADWARVKQAALASGAVPVAFEPISIARANDGTYVYVDGGLWDNKPLGFAIDATFNPEDLGPIDVDQCMGDEQPPGESTERLFVIVQASAELPSTNTRLMEFTPLRVGFDALFTVPRNQTLFADLRRLEKVNSQIRWLDETVTDICKNVNEDDPQVGALRTILLDHCRSILNEKIDLKKSATEKETAVTSGAALNVRYRYDQPDGDASEDPNRPATLSEALRLFAKLVGGIRAKRQIDLDVIQPANDPRDDTRRLSGALLGDFGGFLLKQLRENDYNLGCERAREYVQGKAFAQGPDPPVYQTDASLVDTTLSQLPPKSRLGALEGLVSAVSALAGESNLQTRRPSFVGEVVRNLGKLPALVFAYLGFAGGCVLMLALAVAMIIVAALVFHRT